MNVVIDLVLPPPTPPQTDVPPHLQLYFFLLTLFHCFTCLFTLCVPNRDERSQEHCLSRSLLCPQDLEWGLAHRICFIGSERDRDRERENCTMNSGVPLPHHPPHEHKVKREAPLLITLLMNSNDEIAHACAPL